MRVHMTEFDRNCPGPKVYNDKKNVEVHNLCEIVKQFCQILLVKGAQFSVYFDILFTDLQKRRKKSITCQTA